MSAAGARRTPSVTLLGDLSFHPSLDEALRLSECAVRRCPSLDELGPQHVGSLVVVDGDWAVQDSMVGVRAIHSLPAFASSPVLLVVRREGTPEPVLQYRDGPVELAEPQVAPRSLALRLRALAALTRGLQARVAHEITDATPGHAVARLAGGVAHDFNNILSVISTLSDLLLRLKPDDDPDREDLEEIFNSAQRGSEITRQLSSFSRTGRGDPQHVVVNELLHSNEKMLRRCVGDDSSFTLALDPDAGSVWADPIQLEQMILHLALNASDAMEGGGSVRIATRLRSLTQPLQLDTGLLPAGSYVELEVTDTGEGMDAETRRRLFEPFFTTRGWGRSSGLGLSVVFGVVRGLGGGIDVSSEPGQGSTFRVLLPADAPASEPAAVVEPRGRVGRGAGETLVVVEDHVELRRGLARFLREGGYHVLEADDGAAAEALFREDGVRPHLVLADVVMPRMGGRELERRVHGLGLAVPFLFFSGHTDHVEVGRLRDSGVRVLEKPLDLAQVQEVVRERLEREARRPPTA